MKTILFASLLNTLCLIFICFIAYAQLNISEKIHKEIQNDIRIRQMQIQMQKLMNEPHNVLKPRKK